MDSKPLPVVNSHNGWSPLEEIIVGTPFHLDYSDDISFQLFFYRNIYQECVYDSEEGVWVAFPTGKPSNRLRDELNEDLQGFISILEGEGIRVRQPDVVTEAKTIQSPYWTAALCHALMSRDLFIVIGDEIIETAPMVRSRYFEADLYKTLFTEYFLQGARWTVAPKSRLQDRNFDYSYAVEHGYTGKLPEDPFFEIMFDGPQIVRIGRDLLFNCSNENHRMGLRWLQRHLGSGYRIHEIGITDHHVDGQVIPLKPGTLLVHESVDMSQMPPALQKWDRILYRTLENPPAVDNDGLPLLASQDIGMNVLSLDEDKVMVQDIQIPLIRSLEQAGFTPVPCRWRHGCTVGGGFHCMTLDIRRRSVLEDYLS
jgi:glycine amidinotransferase